MGIDPDARRRWKEHRIGNVPLRSGRGVAAAILIGLAVALALSNPVLVTVSYLRGEPTPTSEITVELLLVNFLFNAIILVVLPVAGLAVARPRPPEPQQPAVPPGSPAFASWTPVDAHGRPIAPDPGAADRTDTHVVDRLGLRVDRRTPLWVVVGAAAAIASIFALGGIIWTLTQVGLEEPEESPLIGEIDALLTWPLVFFIPLVASMTEEIFFRGVLQPRFGLIASSAFFGIVHIGYGTWLQVVAPFFLGLLFGVLFQRSKSLWTAIAAHYTFDFVQLVALKVMQ